MADAERAYLSSNKDIKSASIMLSNQSDCVKRSQSPKY